MAAESFRDEASCSLCLGFFQDPVSIHCGHNFCRGCITRRWEEAQENFPCPNCQETAPQKNLRPNRELAKLIEIAKRLSLKVVARAGVGAGEEEEEEEEKKKKLCQKHQEALKLFCEEDGTPICLVCRESQAHRAHPVVPIEEAAEEEKEKFQAHVGLLKKRREKLLGLKAAEEEKNLDLLERVEKEKEKVVHEAKELQRFLEGQERLLLERLEKLEEEIRRRQEEKVQKLLEDISCLGEEIKELEEKCQQPACEFLLASRNISSRWEKEVPREEEEEEPGDLLPPNLELQEAMRKYR
ncbi:PREDICTED: E3 ubiquitin-protein ligase TRIM39-like, partial [Calidris pugnax]|uniref:E3 ubiquitin-protein ligase TRIM39-like n=1 Tax=Calidris pugnax TaxID=198806 RepID=UPI00071CF8EA